MRQAFAIPIVDEIPNSGPEKENDSIDKNKVDENSNNKKEDNEFDNNFGEGTSDDNTEIKSIGVEDLDSLFPI